MNDVLNNISKEEIEHQGEITTNICCDECSYDTGIMSMSKAVFKINMQGGYFMYDGEGGAITKCPICGYDKLVVSN